MRGRTARRLVIAALALALASCGGDGGGDRTIPYADDGKLTVMTRNLYLGAELRPLLGATDPAGLVAATTAIWSMVRANDFRARAEKLADEIAAAQPDLVGLQEVSLWRSQTPGDAAFGGQTPATTIELDYLAILLDALARRRLAYAPAEVLELADLEAPVTTGAAPGGTDLRLTDRDVILARRGLPIANAQGAAFSALGQVTVLGTTIAVKRGWSSVDATIGGKAIRFANTHLEAFDLTTAGGVPARPAQAAELVAALAGSTGPTVVVGDLNSNPGTEGQLALTQAGFTDVWAALHPTDAGLTCCFAEDLHDAGAALSVRIDDVLVRSGTGALAPESIRVVGGEAQDRTGAGATGLWPSDHAGVVATIVP
jgi:endonuclease/exonuclease/phosphatase family metal-dependent hydrolase